MGPARLLAVVQHGESLNTAAKHPKRRLYSGRTVTRFLNLRPLNEEQRPGQTGREMSTVREMFDEMSLNVTAFLEVGTPALLARAAWH